MSKIICFRHAQASYLSANYDQLSPKGEQQSKLLGEYLFANDIRFDQVFVGPLVRQQKTLEIVADVYAKNGVVIQSPVVLPELKEHHGPQAMRKAYGDLVEKNDEMRAWDNLKKENPASIKKYSLLMFQHFMKAWVEGEIVVDGVETWKAFRENVNMALNQILESTGKGENIAIFSSGGTISSIAAEALKITNDQTIATMNFSIRNTSMNQFLYSKDQFNLHSLNELPHLSKEMETFV